MSDAFSYTNIPGHLEGTLVAAFLTRNDILLCSDGRVVDALTGSVIADNCPKVHQLAPNIGLLTLGRHLPGLVNSFHGKWLYRTAASVHDVATVLRLALEEEWGKLPPFPAQISDHSRAFAFVAGFDLTNQVRLYYLDNQTSPPFIVQERLLFADGSNVEIATMSHGSGGLNSPGNTIARYLADISRGKPALDLRAQLLSSFNSVKNELCLTNSYIGGQTFAAAISLTEAFHFITS